MISKSFLLLCLVGSACAPRASHLRTASALEPPARAQLNVPFFPDGTDLCGPSSLASVLNYWGKTVSPADLKEKIYVPELRGTLPMDLAPMVETKGLSARVVNGSFDVIRSEIRHGRPVLAYLDFGTRFHPIGHFVVVTGFDDRGPHGRRGLIVHSSLHANKFASTARFDRGWKDTYRWMMMVGPRGTAFAVPTETRPVKLARSGRALSAEEYFELGRVYERRGSTSEAAEEYKLALRLRSAYAPAAMALGNLAFENKNYASAEKYYRLVLKHDPDHGGANNNLAMVYLIRDRDVNSATRYATKALTTSYASYATDTLAQIQQVSAERR